MFVILLGYINKPGIFVLNKIVIMFVILLGFYKNSEIKFFSAIFS